MDMNAKDFDAADILFEPRGAAGIVTLNRPKALNAVTHAMVLSLRAQLDAWASDPAVTRVVEAAARKGVTLAVREFSESTHTAEDAAAALGVELGQIVKSLVFVAPADDGSPAALICLVSGTNRVDPARLATAAGYREVRRATAKEAREATGFVIGGIPPIGHPKALRVIMDPDLTRFPVVWCSAGTPTAVFAVPPATLRMLADAHVAPISVEAPHAAGTEGS